MTKEQMTLRQAAAYLQMKNADSLRKQVNRGVLNAYKIGRDWVVDKSEVDRYNATHRRRRE